METIVPEISQSAIYEYNHYIQSQKGEGHGEQYSFEKLGIEDWTIVQMNAEDILRLQTFVESSQTVAPAYIFWKACGRHVTLEGVAKEVLKREEDIPQEARIWVEDILTSNFDKQEIEEKIKKGEIDPPLIFFPVFKGEELEKGLLKVGNILDGNHRLQEVARYLLECSDKEREDFRLTCFWGKVDVIKYATINAQYFAKPTVKKMLVFLKGFMGKEVERIDKKHFMTFFERWYLLLQRIGYYKDKNE
ncbi:MAG: hypothetical protein XD93_0369 [candidate division WS6 bacterium 34_10]|uniref:Uncharacterized protein n=1 Tax=candidate division WS6 bacterium 34_10 TaxID=1641389 RepID=A0A101HIL8_9BACT|nr:MAG: hypothetical protein XD93_0369 [candidate division WS6 bacterium 34_10]